MQQRLHRFVPDLSILVLAAYVAAIGLTTAAPVLTLGGVVGWPAGIAAGVAVALLARRPCGTLVLRLVDG